MSIRLSIASHAIPSYSTLPTHSYKLYFFFHFLAPNIYHSHESFKNLNPFSDSHYPAPVFSARFIFNLSFREPCKIGKQIIRKEDFIHVYSELFCYSFFFEL